MKLSDSEQSEALSGFLQDPVGRGDLSGVLQVHSFIEC